MVSEFSLAATTANKEPALLSESIKKKSLQDPKSPNIQIRKESFTSIFFAHLNVPDNRKL